MARPAVILLWKETCFVARRSSREHDGLHSTIILRPSRYCGFSKHAAAAVPSQGTHRKWKASWPTKRGVACHQRAPGRYMA